ncbi:MAG: aromatic ring-hydroxylating dioxygenase subunit alpha [Pseudomonadota bacterium]
MEDERKGRPEQTYEQIVGPDETGVPDFLAHAATPDVGTDPIDVERYWSPSFREKERQHLWTRTWQLACLVDDIPEAGDCFLYEIGERSLIIANTHEGIRAFYNSCLHRGRRLITGSCTKTKFVCPFHAIAWSLEGKLVHNPLAWDLPQWDETNANLPQARVAVWACFVFINMDDAATDFETVAAPLIEHLAPFGWNERYRAWWYEKRVRGNWKTVQESFMESHHSNTVHPQLLPSIADINSQYDFLNAYVSRHISAAATSSPSLQPTPNEHQKLRLMRDRGDRRVDELDLASLPERFRARTFLGQRMRETYARDHNTDMSHASDAEVLDYLLYTVFPNTAIWAGYGPKLVYRWRPTPGDPEQSIMDIMWMEPVPEGQPKPPPSPKTVVDFDEDMQSQAFGSSSLRLILDQDFANIPEVQRGMKSAKSGHVHFGHYTEARLRYYQRLVDRFIDTGERGAPTPDVELPV